MGKKSTRLRIAFFSIILAGFIVIQFSWMKSFRTDKLRSFRSHVVSAIAASGGTLPDKSLHELNAPAIANTLSQSFSSEGLGNIQFEFSIGSGDNRLASHGFTQKLIDDSRNLTLYYELQGTGDNITDAPTRLTVVIPGWEKYALKNMVWIIAASGFLTIMVIVIFCCAFILVERKRQLFYDNRTDIMRNLMQQLETPLSTMSVAVEALRNRKVMNNSEKRNYYQQIIREESERMNEKVKKVLEDPKIAPEQ